MKTCKSCAYRWIKPGSFIEWHCRRPGKPLVRIGTDSELKSAKGCKEWAK